MKILAVYQGKGIDGTCIGNILVEVENYPPKYEDILDYQKQISEYYNIPECVVTNIIPLAED